MYIAKGADIQQVRHETGHMVDNKLMNQQKVESLKREILGEITDKDICIDNETFIDNNTKVFNELINTINTDYSQAQENLERINKLLVEVESKNKQYDLAINQMNDLMGHLGQLINSLNQVTNKGNETDHE